MAETSGKMAQRLKDSILIEDVMNLILVASKHPVHEVDRIFLCLDAHVAWNVRGSVNILSKR